MQSCCYHLWSAEHGLREDAGRCTFVDDQIPHGIATLKCGRSIDNGAIPAEAYPTACRTRRGLGILRDLQDFPPDLQDLPSIGG